MTVLRSIDSCQVETQTVRSDQTSGGSEINLWCPAARSWLYDPARSVTIKPSVLGSAILSVALLAGCAPDGGGQASSPVSNEAAPSPGNGGRTAAASAAPSPSTTGGLAAQQPAEPVGDACVALGRLVTNAAAAAGKPGWKWQAPPGIDLSGFTEDVHKDGEPFKEYRCAGYAHAPEAPPVQSPTSPGRIYVILHVDAARTADDTVHTETYYDSTQKCRLQPTPLIAAPDQAQALETALAALASQLHDTVLACEYRGILKPEAGVTSTGLTWAAWGSAGSTRGGATPLPGQDLSTVFPIKGMELLLAQWLVEIRFDGHTAQGFHPFVLPTLPTGVATSLPTTS